MLWFRYKGYCERNKQGNLIIKLHQISKVLEKKQNYPTFQLIPNRRSNN